MAATPLQFRICCHASSVSGVGCTLNRAVDQEFGVTERCKGEKRECVVNHHALMEGWPHAFLALALDGCGQLHLPAALTSQNESCPSHWIGSRVDPTFDQGAVESRYPLHVMRIEPCLLRLPARGLVTILTEPTQHPPPPVTFRVTVINSEI
jgi:hypothetical protein